MTRQLTAIEIFAGGGGLAVGLKKAGFQAIAAVELEPHAAATFKANHPEVQVFQQNIQEISGASFLDLAGGHVDVLAACPPCQGFSSLTAKSKKHDPRNELVLEVARLTEEMKPTAVMVENVPGLARRGRVLFDQLIERLEHLGYICSWDVLQVADYGVPQMRRRLVLLAGLGFEISLPKQTHSKNGTDDTERWKTVHEAIGHMGKAINFVDAKKNGGPSLADWHVVRELSPLNQARLASTTPGKSREEIPDHLRPNCHRNGYTGFSNVYGRLDWQNPSTTITAGCTTLSKGRFGHPTEQRTISLREAALLQTFPADYDFVTDIFDRACEMVGNALPCDFAEAIARQVATNIHLNDRT